MISQSWTLRAQSELPGMAFLQMRLPGSQVLRSWLCWLQWFLIENRYNLPIVGMETPGLFHGPSTLPFAISSTPLIPKARSCGHSPRKHNLRSHRAAHANPAIKAQTALWCGQPPTGTRGSTRSARQSCGWTRLNLNPGRRDATFARLLALLFAPPS